MGCGLGAGGSQHFCLAMDGDGLLKAIADPLARTVAPEKTLHTTGEPQGTQPLVHVRVVVRVQHLSNPTQNAIGSSISIDRLAKNWTPAYRTKQLISLADSLPEVGNSLPSADSSPLFRRRPGRSLGRGRWRAGSAGLPFRYLSSCNGSSDSDPRDMPGTLRHSPCSARLLASPRHRSIPASASLTAVA